MEKNKKSPLRALLEEPKHGHLRLDDAVRAAATAFAADYMSFLDEAKTERESVRWTASMAERNGFKPYRRGMELKVGDRVYTIGAEKAIILAVIGTEPLTDGCNIAAAHVDAPRIDIKPCPLYEDSELAYFKTHYYGGIKKYQWLNIPLELRGAVALKNGTTVEVSLGKDAADPVLVISDILPHLAAEQMKKTMSEGVAGETLNVILGSLPECNDDGTDRVKLAVMGILNELYGINEADLHSAELSLVPAMNSRDVGLDRSLIGGYGHDDRSCGYAIVRAIFDAKTPKHTAIGILCDKEEIGSEGLSGMQSRFFDTFMEDICETFDVLVRAVYEKAFCLSCDVAAAFDPNWAQPFDKRNAARLNYGLGVCKYTGVRGKGDASDANAETVAKLRRILDDAGVLWQMAPLGAVDAGGGGTVAKYMANRNIETLDAGVPVLSMHAPWEIISKLDLYETYRAVLAIYND